MNKQEFAILATAIIAAYPSSKILGDTASMDLWYQMLQDIDYDVAQNAVKEYICTQTFAPSIGEIRKLCMERCKPRILPFDEAWGTVVSAMQKHGFYNPQKAYEMMDPLTLSIVKNLGWSNLCQSDNLVASRANFREAYEAKAAQKMNREQLPEWIQREKEQLIEQKVPKPATIEQKTEPKKIDAKENTEPAAPPPAGMWERVRKGVYGS